MVPGTRSADTPLGPRSMVPRSPSYACQSNSRSPFTYPIAPPIYVDQAVSVTFEARVMVLYTTPSRVTCGPVTSTRGG